jgi:hypothetical protein
MKTGAALILDVGFLSLMAAGAALILDVGFATGAAVGCRRSFRQSC